ncbi:MAG TPA: hypothetical protein VJ829_11435, partial [Candidatus Binatia bacterium]|nr:hypothetical protein [Candidatus Binatia bacterium]
MPTASLRDRGVERKRGDRYRFGASRLHALAAAFFVLATPLVRQQVSTMHVDLPLAAFFAAGLSFALAH